MAADLKSVLRSVVSSRGAKKFYFAYAPGKRTDGKGDGELVVRGAKPKKTEIEAAIVGCKEVLEGVCWSGKGPDDVGTVYFKGSSKTVSQMGVAKMAITAKKLTGSQYDFQIPSTAKEAPEQDAEEEEEEEKPDKEALAKAKALKERLKGLLGRAKILFVRAPSQKAKVAPLMTAASNKVEKDDDEAEAAVDKFEEALDAADKAAAAGNGNGNGNGAGASATEREAAAYKARVDALMPELKKAVAKNNEPAKEAKLRFSESQVFGRKKEFPKAMQLLDVVEKQMKKALAAPAPGEDDAKKEQDAQDDAPDQGNGDDEAPAARGRSGATEKAPAGGPAEAAKKLAAAGKAFQTRLDAMMPKLKKAVATGNPAGKEAKLRYSEAQVFARKKDFDQANGVLDVIEERMNAALAAAAAPSPQAKAFATRSKAVVEDVKKAIASGHPAGNEAKLKYSEAQVFARKGDFAQARKLMDEVEDLAASALVAPAPADADAEQAEADVPDGQDGQDDDEIPPAPPAPKDEAEGDVPEAPPLDEPADPKAKAEAKPAAPASPQEKAYNIRLKAVKADVDRAVATGTQEGKDAKLRFSEAQVFGRKKDFDKARELLDKVEELNAAAMAAPAPATDDADADAQDSSADPTASTDDVDQDEAEDEIEDAADKDEDEIPDAPALDEDETDAQAEVEPEAAPATPEAKGFRTRSKAVAEDVKRAVATGTPEGKEAKLKFSQAQVAGRKGDFAAARALLDEVEELNAAAMVPAAPALDEDETDAQAEIEPEDAPATPEAKGFRTRSKAVAEDVKRAVATGTPEGKEAKLKFSQAQVAGRKGDFAAARALLDEVEELNAAAMVPAAPDLDDDAQESDAEADEPAAESSPEEKAFGVRSKAVAEDVKRAVASGKPEGKEAKMKFSQAQVAGRKKDFEAARALLDEVEELNAKAMAADAAGDAQEDEDDQPGSPEQKAYAKRAKTVAETARKAAASGHPAGQQAAQMLTLAEGAAERQDFQTAAAYLDQVEMLAKVVLGAEGEASEEQKAVAARIDTVRAVVQKSSATGHPAGMQAADLFGRAEVAASRQAFDAARSLLDQVEQLNRVVLGAAADAEPSQEEKAFTARVETVGAAVRKAAATGHPAGVQAADLFGRAEVAASRQAFDAARGLLDQAEALAAQADVPDAPDLDEPAQAEPEQPEPEPQAKPSADEKAFATRSKAVAEDVKRAVASGTPEGKEAKMKFSQAQVAGRKKDFADARALLDEVEELVAAALVPAAPDLDDDAQEDDVEEEPAAEPAAKPSADEKAFATRSKAVGEDVKRAVASGAPAGKEAKLRFSAAQTAGRKKDFQAARALLDEVEELNAKAQTEAQAQAAAEAGAANPQAAAAAKEKRGKEVQAVIDALGDNPEAAGLQALFDLAVENDALTENDFMAEMADVETTAKEVAERTAQAQAQADDQAAAQAAAAQAAAQAAPNPQQDGGQTASAKQKRGKEVQAAIDALGDNPERAGLQALFDLAEGNDALTENDFMAEMADVETTAKEVAQRTAQAQAQADAQAQAAAAPDLDEAREAEADQPDGHPDETIGFENEDGPAHAQVDDEGEAEAAQQSARQKRGKEVSAKVKALGGHPAQGGIEMMLEVALGNPALSDEEFERELAEVEAMVKTIADQAAPAQEPGPAADGGEESPAPAPQGDPAPAPTPDGGQAEAAQQSARQKRGKEVSAKVKALGGHPAQGGIEMMLEVALGNPALSDEDFERELAEVEAMVKTIADQAAPAQEPGPAADGGAEAPAPASQGEAPAPGGQDEPQAEASQARARQQRGTEVSAKVKGLGGHPAQGGIEMMLEVALGNPALSDEEFEREMAEVEAMVKAIADQAAEGAGPAAGAAEDGPAPAP